MYTNFGNTRKKCSGLFMRVLTLFVLLSINALFTTAVAAECIAITNVASSGSASQSSNFRGTLFPAIRAIDGLLTNFSHTERGQSPASWAVDLAESSILNEVVLHNRDTRSSRLRDITVRILDDAGAIVFQTPLLNPENVLGSPDLISIPVPDGIVGTRIEVERTPDPDLVRWGW